MEDDEMSEPTVTEFEVDLSYTEELDRDHYALLVAALVRRLGGHGRVVLTQDELQMRGLKVFLDVTSVESGVRLNVHATPQAVS